MRTYLLFIVFLILFSSVSFCQNKRLIGINNSWDINDGEGRYGIGFVYEQQLSKHSGFETGIYYSSLVFNNEVSFSLPSTSTPIIGKFKIRENYISLPVLYKFYSSIVNISIGANLDYYVGWNELGSDSKNVVFDSYKKEQKSYFGVLAKISKSIKVSHNIVFEPEIKINPSLNNSRLYYGVGLSAKYILNSKKK